MVKYIFMLIVCYSTYAQDSPLEFYTQEIFETEIVWIDNDLSGVTLNNNTNNLYMIEDDNGMIWESDIDFNYIRTIIGAEFGDAEDIIYLNNDEYAIVTEEGKLFIGYLYYGENNIDINNFQIITFSDHEGNDGAEGVTYDSLSQIFYIVKEKEPMEFYVFQRPNHGNDTTITVEIPFDAEIEFSGIISDLSSIAFDYRTNRVLIVSDESQKIIDVNPSNGMVLGEIILSGMEQPEGLCFINDNHDLLIVGEPNYYTIYSNMSVSGDLNFDGQINYFDMEIIIEYLISNIVLSSLQSENADLNYDQKIDIIDALLIIDLANN